MNNPIDCRLQNQPPTQGGGTSRLRKKLRIPRQLTHLMLLLTTSLSLMREVNAAFTQIGRPIIKLTGVTQVSETSSISAQLTKYTASIWDTDSCFQIYVNNQYADKNAYTAWKMGTTPKCTCSSSLTNNKPTCTVKCKLVEDNAKHQVLLQLYDLKVTPNERVFDSLTFEIDGFRNPFSAISPQAFTIQALLFDDSQCIGTSKTQNFMLQQFNFQSLDLTDQNVKVTTFNDGCDQPPCPNYLADDSSRNTLRVSLKYPKNILFDPRGSGIIRIMFPYQYEYPPGVVFQKQPLYTNLQNDNCRSTCFNIIKSVVSANDDSVDITYNSMLAECLVANKEVVIECRKFKNPLFPEITKGFSVIVFDGQENSKTYIALSKDIGLDASKYLPAQAQNDIEFFPSYVNQIETQKWAPWKIKLLQLSTPLPNYVYQQQEPKQYNYVKFRLPNELQYDIKYLEPGFSFFPNQEYVLLPANDPKCKENNLPDKACFIFKSEGDPGQAYQPVSFDINIDQIRSPQFKKETDKFEIHIYKEQDAQGNLIKKFIEFENGGFSFPQDQIKPNVLLDVSIKPKNQCVGEVTTQEITFRTSSQLIGTADTSAGVRVRLPYSLTPIVAQLKGSYNGRQVAVKQPDPNVNEVVFYDLIKLNGGSIEKDTTVTILIEGIRNQRSAKNAGDYLVTTVQFVGTKQYEVDQSRTEDTKTSFVAETGDIKNIKIEVEQDGAKNAKQGVQYTFTFDISHPIPSSGYIDITLPATLSLDPATTRSLGACRVYACIDVEKNYMRILISEGMAAGTGKKLEIAGIINPRSFAPTSAFTIKTVDSDQQSFIDTGDSEPITMNIPGDMPNFKADYSNDRNGEVNQYTLSFSQIIPILTTDKFEVVIPEEMYPPASKEEMNCKVLANVIKIACEVDGRTLRFQFLEVENAANSIRWTIDGIKNAPSTKPSLISKGVRTIDAGGFTIAVPPPTAVTNMKPYILTDKDVEPLDQDNLEHGETAIYTIKFRPQNPLPKTGTIIVYYPSHVESAYSSSADCAAQIQTAGGAPIAANAQCTVKQENRQITIQNLFSSDEIAAPGFLGLVTIAIKMKNPPTNNPEVNNGFIIQTYQDKDTNYIQDKLPDTVLKPRFKCVYPCMNCDPATPTICTDCWEQETDPRYLMKYDGGKATCKPRCDPGFTSNGNPEKICEPCDESCKECRDLGLVYDKLQCTVCSATHPYQYFRFREWEPENVGPKARNMCIKECGQGLFESSPKICSECSYPCLNCEGSADKCTECFYKGYKDDKLWNLYQDTCVPECPDGTVSMIADVVVSKYTDIFRDNEKGIGGNGRHGFCETCHETCKTCKERPENCVLCQPTFPLLYQERCLDVCPRGSVQSATVAADASSSSSSSSQSGNQASSNQGSNSASSSLRLLADANPANSADQNAAAASGNTDFAQCIACEKGCDECEADDITVCHKCTRPFYSHKGKCVEKCPSGFHPDWPELDGRACREWRLGDAGTIPYPFLICFLIFTIIIGFGMMIRRGYIYKGKAQMESPQNLVVCLLLACTPLQFLSTAASTYLSWVYGVKIFTLVYGIVVVLALVINIIYMYNYKRHFDAMRIPMEYERRWRLGKMKRSEALKYKEPVDQKFHNYKKMYPCFVYIVYLLQVLLGFRMNMTFYSFFYDLRPFKAHWSRVKYYRKQITWYLIAWIVCVDLTNIVIDITCMTQIHVQNTHFENRIWYVSQLWITVIENLVLSIISFLLAVFAMEKIKTHLEYCEPKKDKLKFKAAKNTESDDSWSDYQNLDKKFDKGKMTERNLLMNDLLRRVKFNKMIFLNNKLDELLGAFGSRKCKSMLDLGTGWPLEDDPRLAITWPCSPGLREDYNEQLGEDFRFSKEDAFGVQGNNVYADVKSKFMGMEIGTQDDAGFLEFQDALNRKHGGLMSQTEGDLEERRMKRKNRRRGRKNKYYAQIDHEDDQEAQLADASDAEEQLQVIREQEEEEENLRKAVQAEAQKQKELAAQRKREQEEKLAQKQAQEMLDADARKRKAQEIEAQELAEQKAETERNIRNAKLSKQLQEETARERKVAEENQKKREVEMAQKSAAERAKYEKEEAERKAKEAADAKLKKEQQSQAENQRLIDEQKAREKELQQRLQNQQKKDVNDLTANKEKNAKEDADREAMKRNKLTMSPAMTEMNKTIKEADKVMLDMAGENQIDAPPKHELRTFNENDILGDLPRDERGNVVVQAGQIKDKEGNPINPRGYLIDAETGNIVENQTFQTMFKKEELDARGEIPAPFCLERFNFNPHNLMGDFDYSNGKPELMQSQQGFFIDKRSRRCNKHGWMVLLNQGHIVDISGRKRFDKNQLQPDGDLHKLLNYQGRKFDIKEIMGTFEKDEKSQIIIQKSQKGGSVDLLGRRVNEKGYLVDGQGNIIDTQQRVVFEKYTLKNGEFQKIFQFTKFNIKQIQGNCEVNANGQPQLQKGKNGAFVDKQGRTVNQKGYLIDSEGNVVDQNGNLVFDKVILGKDGDIPPVFRMGLLQDDNSNMDALMSEIERGNNRRPRLQNEEGETSMDSKMEDTPANYNAQNANRGRDGSPGQGNPLTSEDDEYGGQHQGPSDDDGTASQRAARKNKKKKKGKLTTVEVLPPTKREKVMADAYGGQAVGTIRRPGVKYDKDRLKDAKQFRVNTAEEPQLRAKLTQLVKSPSGANAIEQLSQLPPNARNQGFMGTTQQRESIGVDSNAGRSGPDSQAHTQNQARRARAQPGAQDFEEIFGKDIDQFLEDSEWDENKQK